MEVWTYIYTMMKSYNSSPKKKHCILYAFTSWLWTLKRGFKKVYKKKESENTTAALKMCFSWNQL